MQRQGSSLENCSRAFLTGSSFLIWKTKTQICNNVTFHSCAASRCQKAAKYTDQDVGPGAGADEILAAQTEMIVVTFQHVRHAHAQQLPVGVHLVRQPPS